MSMSNSESRKREAAQVVAPDVETLAQVIYRHVWAGEGMPSDEADCCAEAVLASDWLADHDARLRESIAMEIEALPWDMNNHATVTDAARIARGQ